MKKVRVIKSLAEDIPKGVKREHDPEGETISELCASTHQSPTWMWKYARAQVAAGHWLAVWKFQNSRWAPAYKRASERGNEN